MSEEDPYFMLASFILCRLVFPSCFVKDFQVFLEFLGTRIHLMCVCVVLHSNYFLKRDLDDKRKSKVFTVNFLSALSIFVFIFCRVRSNFNRSRPLQEVKPFLWSKIRLSVNFLLYLWSLDTWVMISVAMVDLCEWYTSPVDANFDLNSVKRGISPLKTDCYPITLEGGGGGFM